MKIAHISDIHYAPKTLAEVDRCFAFAVARAIEEQCDAAVLSGDIFDHRVDLHAPAVSAVLRRVHELAEHMPVLILQGTYSHDVPGSLDVFKTMGARYPVFVADRICQVGLCLSKGRTEGYMGGFESSDGSQHGGWTFDAVPEYFDVVFSCLPSVNKGAVAAIVGGENAAEAVGEHVHGLLKGWAPINKIARERGIPTVLVSHGTVSGCINEQGVPMAGLDHEFTTGTLFAAETTAVMLGHIHQHQMWDNGQGRVIAYPGSVGRLHFGEVTPKGFLLWSVWPETAAFEFIETPAKKLLQIEFPGVPDMQELANLVREVDANTHIRIRYSVDEEHRHSVDRAAIAALFPIAAELKIEGRVNPIQRQRSAGITTMSLGEKLMKWGEVTQTETAPLIERLHLLEHQEPEAIAAEILGETTKKKTKAA